MFESMNYIPGFRDTYSGELDSIEAAAERARAYIERETALLTRPDGSLVYGPAEHRERLAAILETAGSQFDAAVRRHVEQSERTVADLEKKLALLDRDPLDALNPDEQAKAAARREFVREDVERLPATELAKRIRAAVAGGDRVTATLLARYLEDRDDLGGSALRDAVRELRTFLGDDERYAKRRDLEARMRAARALPVAVSSARRAVDGSQQRLEAQMRQHAGVAL